MKKILPLKGVRYQEKKSSAFSKLVAPPYDVISDADAKRLQGRSSRNIVNLILPKRLYKTAKDPYKKAASLFKTWQKEGTLIQDEEASFYFYHQSFSAQVGSSTKKITRKGFLCLRRLEEMGTSIFPHERTLSKPKKDRTLLMKACGANLSPIFSLYSDPSKKVEKMMARTLKKPLWSFISDDGVAQKFWKVSDPKIINQISAHLGTKKLYIADGHHRYETSLGLSKKGGPKYTLMFLSNLNDPGLLVLPTHRLLKGKFNYSWETVQKRTKGMFDLTSFSVNPSGKKAFLKYFYSSKKYALGFVSKERYAVLETSVPRVRKKLPGFEASRARLGSSLLHDLFFSKLLKSKGSVEDNFTFVKEEAALFKSVSRGEGGAGFLLQAADVKDIITICEGGETLPQKTTYFYPKLLSGLVINKFE